MLEEISGVISVETPLVTIIWRYLQLFQWYSLFLKFYRFGKCDITFVFLTRRTRTFFKVKIVIFRAFYSRNPCDHVYRQKSFVIVRFSSRFFWMNQYNQILRENTWTHTVLNHFFFVISKFFIQTLPGWLSSWRNTFKSQRLNQLSKKIWNYMKLS